MKAEDTAFGKQEKITITSKKSQLSLREIKHIVWEAEDFAVDDKKVKQKIDALNTLEAFIIRNKGYIIDKNELAGKLEADSKKND